MNKYLSGKPGAVQYVYYHCTRVHRTPKCTQPSIEEKELNRQVTFFLDGVTLPERILIWFSHELSESKAELANVQSQIAKKLSTQVGNVKKQLSNLTDLRVREILTDNEFTTKRERLQRELGKAEENVSVAENRPATFEPLQILQIVSTRAKYWFSIADEQTKRALLRILCSNPTLKDKNALLVARKPFVDLNHFLNCLNLRGDLDDVRNTTPRAKGTHNVVLRRDVDDVRKDNTTCTRRTEFQKKLEQLASDPEIKELAEEARAVIERMEPELLDKL